jgi:3'-phosphoadenosine 5'-phosphosulfate sulfotransferase (PAPS reductase)/FAD synthetase
MTFDEKLAGAHRVIKAALGVALRPAIMCSFGKDSMVVLHQARALGYRLPVIFHREPFLPRKYRFSRQMIARWDLTVYDFPPQGTAVQANGEQVEVVNYYPAGARPCALPTGLVAPQTGETPLCALHDFYLKPTGTFAYPWDVVLHGHKSSDIDPIYGAIPLAADFARNLDSVSAAFPLRHFTDADVWEYHRRFAVPIHVERYDEAADYRERADKTANPDYFPACWACMQPGGGAVPCQRLGGALTSNVAAQLRWAKKEAPAYLQKETSHHGI